MRHLLALPAARTRHSRRGGGAAFLAALLALAVLVPSAYTPARADDDPPANETASLVLRKNVEVDPPTGRTGTIHSHGSVTHGRQCRCVRSCRESRPGRSAGSRIPGTR